MSTVNPIAVPTNNPRMNRTIPIAMLWIQTVALLAVQVAGQSAAPSWDVEFRIDTDVYADESKPPIISTKVMFLKDRILEWDDSHERLMVIDYPNQQIVLADFKSRRTCTLGMVEMESKLDALRAELTEDQIKQWSSMVPPSSEADGSEILQSERIKYQFRAVTPRISGMSTAYADFADWAVRVSAVYPPFKPPLLRMQLNQHCKELGRLPTEIRLWDLRAQSAQPLVARMLVQEGLTDKDKMRVRDWSTLSSTLKPVSADEYFKSPSVASSKSISGK